VLSCAVLLACSNGSGTDDGGVDASVDVKPKPDGGGPADAAADVPMDTSTACNSLVAPDATVMEMYVATAAVTGDGGLFIPGTYVTTGRTIYTGVDGSAGPTGTTYDVILVVDDAGVYQALQIATDSGGVPGVLDLNGQTTVFDGGGALMKADCPINGTLIFTSYSSDGTNVGFYAPTTKPPQALFMTRQ
jgi:hypothetical protein